MSEPLTTSVTVSHKIQTAPYESAEVSITVNNIREDTTPDEIDRMLMQSKVGYTTIRDELRARIAAVRAGDLKTK